MLQQHVLNCTCGRQSFDRKPCAAFHSVLTCRTGSSRDIRRFVFQLVYLCTIFATLKPTKKRHLTLHHCNFVSDVQAGHFRINYQSKIVDFRFFFLPFPLGFDFFFCFFPLFADAAALAILTKSCRNFLPLFPTPFPPATSRAALRISREARLPALDFNAAPAARPTFFIVGAADLATLPTVLPITLFKTENRKQF